MGLLDFLFAGAVINSVKKAGITARNLLRMDMFPTMTMGMRKATMIAVMTTVITMIMIVKTPTIVVATTMTVKTIGDW